MAPDPSLLPPTPSAPKALDSPPPAPASAPTTETP
jgi:hypothetical protein